MSEVKISDLIIPKFHEVWAAIRDGRYQGQACDEIWMKGGRGSTKSSLAALAIIHGIMSDPDANAVGLRKVGDTIRTSIHTTLLWAIDALNVTPYFHSTRSPSVITYLPTGQMIEMRGLDDKRKLKSVKFRRGYAKFLWCEELDEFSGMEEIRSIKQSVLRGGKTFVQINTYNPPRDPASWVNKEANTPHPGRIVIPSTYLDVPPQWLGAKFIADAEALKLHHPEIYQHEYMGDAVGNVERLVFWGKWEILDFPEPSIEEIYQGRFFYGADWGYVDPTAGIRCFIKDQCLYVDQEVYKTRVELEDLPKFFEDLLRAKEFRIWADSALPATISYMQRHGYPTMQSVKKSTKKDKPEEKTTKDDYIEDGVNYLRGTFKKIYIHPRCVNTIREFSLYCYDVDKHDTSIILPSIVDANNHAIDALRYALSDYIRNKVSILQGIH